MKDINGASISNNPFLFVPVSTKSLSGFSLFIYILLHWVAQCQRGHECSWFLKYCRPCVCFFEPCASDFSLYSTLGEDQMFCLSGSRDHSCQTEPREMIGCDINLCWWKGGMMDSGWLISILWSHRNACFVFIRLGGGYPANSPTGADTRPLLIS